MATEPLLRAISELREELRRIDQVILMLQSLSGGRPRRGRPPKFMTPGTSTNGRRTQRKKASSAAPKRRKSTKKATPTA